MLGRIPYILRSQSPAAARWLDKHQTPTIEQMPVEHGWLVRLRDKRSGDQAEAWQDENGNVIRFTPIQHGG